MRRLLNDEEGGQRTPPLVAGRDRAHRRRPTPTHSLLSGGAEGFGSGTLAEAVEIFNDHGESIQTKTFPSDAEAPDDPNVTRVLLKKVRVEPTRRFGDRYLGLELWKRLGLEKFFAQRLDRDGADVAWSRVAAVLVINRSCTPGSELALEQHWYPSTAMDDLLHIEKGTTIEGREILLRRINKLAEEQKILHQLQPPLPERL